jgi:hypothetical protein
MPKLYISVWEHVARDAVNTPIPIPQTPPLCEDWVEITTESRQSHVFDERARFITVTVDVPCCLAFGEDPEAEISYHPVMPGVEKWYGVRSGHRLAVIEYT